MCFSMLASVAAGTVLSVAGVATVTLVRRRAELPLALLPLLFGVQQLIEGVVWWSLEHGGGSQGGTSTLAYTLFSHVLWPAFVPFAFLSMEQVAWRRRVLGACVVIGLGVAAHGLFTVATGPRTAQVSGGSIQYEMPSWYVIALYLVATCVGAFFSSHVVIRVLGASALALALVTLWLYTAVFVSVWCFFSALLSGLIFAYFLLARRASSGVLPRVLMYR